MLPAGESRGDPRRPARRRLRTRPRLGVGRGGPGGSSPRSPIRGRAAAAHHHHLRRCPDPGRPLRLCGVRGPLDRAGRGGGRTGVRRDPRPAVGRRAGRPSRVSRAGGDRARRRDDSGGEARKGGRTRDPRPPGDPRDPGGARRRRGAAGACPAHSHRARKGGRRPRHQHPRRHRHPPGRARGGSAGPGGGRAGAPGGHRRQDRLRQPLAPVRPGHHLRPQGHRGQPAQPADSRHCGPGRQRRHRPARRGRADGHQRDLARRQLGGRFGQRHRTHSRPHAVASGLAGDGTPHPDRLHRRPRVGPAHRRGGQALGAGDAQPHRSHRRRRGNARSSARRGAPSRSPPRVSRARATPWPRSTTRRPA